MYTLEWVKNFEGFKDGEYLDLHSFALFYDKYIAENRFIYTTSSKLLPSFVIETRQNQLPHLMALQHWNNLKYRQPTKQYQQLIKGELNLSTLEKADNGAYSKYLERIEGLPLLYHMLHEFNCRVKLLNNSNDSPFQRRKINMIFQKDNNKTVYILELRKRNDNVFLPVSISVYRQGASALQIKSEPLTVTDVTIEPISNSN